jgi:hypothetical protein
VTTAAGEPLDQDLVALRAGTVLPAGTDESQVPPGAMGLTDYRYDLPLVEPALAGTSARRLAGAIEELSEGALRCVPLSGGWDAETVVRVVERGRSIDARLIANIRSGLLWGSRPGLQLVLGWLDGVDLLDLPAPPPPADWDVGHFVELVSTIRGRAHGRAFVVVHDSYPTLGWDGHHLQPPDALAAALERGDGHGGGVLLVVRAEHSKAAVALGAGLGLDIEMWDNGTGDTRR